MNHPTLVPVPVGNTTYGNGTVELHYSPTVSNQTQRIATEDFDASWVDWQVKLTAVPVKVNGVN